MTNSTRECDTEIVQITTKVTFAMQSVTLRSLTAMPIFLEIIDDMVSILCRCLN